MDLMPVNSGNSQDEDSESDSSADSSSLSNYDSAVFQSSLRSFQMSESKRKRLRELEASEKLFKSIFVWVRFAENCVPLDLLI